MLHGIVPGPTMFREAPEIIYTILVGLLIANLFNFFIGLLLSGLFAHVAGINPIILVPFLTVLATIGVYTTQFRLFDVIFVVLIGVFAYVLKAYGYPLAPMLLGFVLAPMAESYLRRAMIIGRGNFLYLIQTPITKILYAVAIIIFIVLMFSDRRKKELNK